jgi:glycosyltransferase involved in cell wall biosynthesis
MVARLLRAKGTLEYIETAVRLSRRHDNVEFVLVGAPDPGSDSIDFSIVEGAVVSGALRYFPFTDDIVQHYINCDVYVLPSYREGMPVTIMEAMAVGRPIITSDVPGCREMVDGNGWLVHPANVQALEECCELVCSSREKLEALGLLSRSLAEKRFDVKFLSRRQVDIIEMSSRLR